MARESPAEKIARISRVSGAWEADAADTVFSWAAAGSADTTFSLSAPLARSRRGSGNPT
jgi:hypothetical protein